MKTYYLRSFILLFILSLSLSIAHAQHAIGSKTITFTDPARGNRSIATEIYYPATLAGTNSPIVTDSFPVLVCGHGFVMTVDAYYYLRDSLVPEGYILLLPTTEGSFSPSHSSFGADLAFLVDAMQQEGQSPTSDFFGHIRIHSAIMGHSMGAGAAFLAAENNTQIAALAVLAPAETNPSAIAAATNITVPSLVFAGANDCVTPPPAHQEPMYDSLAAACKTYVSITGGSHCQFGNNNTLCNFGEITCGPPAAISRGAQHALVLKYLRPFLGAQLKGDAVANSAFQALVDNPVNVTTEQDCASPITALNQIVPADFSVFPNPTSGRIVIRHNFQDLPFSIRLYQYTGVEVFSKENINESTCTLELPELPKGIYWLRLEAGNGRFMSKPLVVE